MTKKECKAFIEDLTTHKNYTLKKGYCCYQDDNLDPFNLIKIGSNSGVYGWNWTLYIYPENKTIYLSSYRF